MPDKPVTLSLSAAQQILTILRRHTEAHFLRVSVEGGGCSGFQYKFDFAETPDHDDHIIERDGARVLIDSISLELLAGSEIDYVNELIGAAFKIHNPNAVAACGCGTSFAL